MNSAINWKAGLISIFVLVVGLGSLKYFLGDEMILPLEVLFIALAALPYFRPKKAGFILASILLMQLFYLLWGISLKYYLDIEFLLLYDILILVTVIVSGILLMGNGGISLFKNIFSLTVHIGVYTLLVALALQLGHYAYDLWVFSPLPIPTSLIITIPWLAVYLINKRRGEKVSPLRKV